MPELDRRDFLKVVGLSAGAAATVGCQDPVEKIVRYLNQPEDVTPGIATYYNSLCREWRSARGGRSRSTDAPGTRCRTGACACGDRPAWPGPTTARAFADRSAETATGWNRRPGRTRSTC
ncbi:MAG: twin-arginine translocation signal domain-containing protein [Proteobacteria bacterium]|nr:twin-arginine translocation signal domain-containing protein [Pseudomonadota bacterium]